LVENAEPPVALSSSESSALSARVLGPPPSMLRARPVHLAQLGALGVGHRRGEQDPDEHDDAALEPPFLEHGTEHTRSLRKS